MGVFGWWKKPLGRDMVALPSSENNVPSTVALHFLPWLPFCGQDDCLSPQCHIYIPGSGMVGQGERRARPTPFKVMTLAHLPLGMV